ncbi:A24 family peptidase [Acidithrix sp. C25]|uniref:prepilin peptidase n=1 Tax=Acidithrix sp. C25 TaxID=1671482 RepID=UPI00191BA3B3|nr:A24 family peptidase [Acidithrix sp. C25]
MTPNGIFVALFAVVGLAVGSFLNVVIWRVPRGESIVLPPSHCTSCGYRLRAVDNLPIASFLALRGQCHSCGSKISVRYPLVELSTGALFGLVAALFGRTFVAPQLALFSASLVCLALIDIETRKLPRKIIYPSALVTFLLIVAYCNEMGSFHYLVSSIEGFGIDIGIFGLIFLLRPSSIGFGDVRLAGFIGLNLGVLGLNPTINFLYGAFGFGSIFGIGYILLVSRSVKSSIPFGPFMALSALTSMVIGNSFRIF